MNTRKIKDLIETLKYKTDEICMIIVQIIVTLSCIILFIWGLCTLIKYYK